MRLRVICLSLNANFEMGLVYLFRTFEAKLGVRDGVEIDISERLNVV